VAVALLASACGSSSPPAAAAPTTTTTAYSGPVAAVVILKAKQYTPAKVTIQAGQTVEWKWEGQSIHNVVFAGYSSPSQVKGVWYHTFDTAGTYFYRCTFHPNMIGEVVVE
jgi:plastocyanin